MNQSLNEIAVKYNAELLTDCIKLASKKLTIMLPIPGTASIEHLEENVRADDISLSDDDYNELEREYTGK